MVDERDPPPGEDLDADDTAPLEELAAASGGGAIILPYTTQKYEAEQARLKRLEQRNREKAEQDRQRRQHAPKLEEIEVFTEAELAALPIEPLVWLVTNMIPAGVWICSAPPKIGKSFLMTLLCRSVSLGTMFAGYAHAVQQQVLYLDLEGTKRRAQIRQRRIRGEEAPSTGFRSLFTFAPMDAGGIEELDKAIVKWKLGLIVIDVWAAFRPARTKNEDAYAYDHRSMGPILDLAKRRNVSIILVHHNRKQADADFVSEVSGSTAMTGRVDGVITIKRGRTDDIATVSIAARDADSLELAARYTDGLWHIIGDAREFFASESRKTIHAVLANGGAQGLSSKDVIDISGIARSTAMRVLRKMVDDGVAKRMERGRYGLTDTGFQTVPH